MPLIVVLAIAIRIDSPGPVFIRLRRVGRDGCEFGMLKFRKMRVADYVERVLPQKVRLDQMYAERRSVGMDLRILLGTIFVTVFRGEIAVHRASGRLTVRHRPAPAAVDATEVVGG